MSECQEHRNAIDKKENTMANQAKRNFKQAPLPFVGQKRNFLNHFKAILNEQIPGDGEGWTIVDTFGGSSLF